MKILLFLPFLSIFWTSAVAQSPDEQNSMTKKMSLNDCMTYAVEHNTGVKKQELTNENYRQDRLNTTASLLPSINGEIAVQNNYGRGIDPETNTYVNTETFYNTYGIGSQMPVFAGLTNINTYRASKLMQKIGVEQLQIIKDNVALSTMQAFMSVVYYSASVEISKQQLQTSTKTLEQSKKMLSLGLKSAADVAQIESQVASNDLSLTQQQNELNNAILKLKEQMNFAIDEELCIDTCLSVDVVSAPSNITGIVDFALSNNPKIIQTNLNVNRSKIQYQVAVGKIFPSITVYAGYSTQYYNNELAGDLPNFKTQFKDNRGTYIGATLSIPIFNGLSRKTNLSKQRNNWRIAAHENEETKRTLQTEITQTALQMEGYGKEFVQASKKVEAAELAHRASIQKFEKGLISPIELQTSANDLLLAKSQQLNARLQHFIKGKMLKYYSGEALVKL